MIKAFATTGPKTQLKPFEFDPGPLAPEQVEVHVESCGICHSDLSMADNEWGMTQYPFVPGHEAVGKVVAVGERVKIRKVGDRVGVGWFSKSCMICPHCLSGDQNLCVTPEQTIIHRHGAFASKVRCEAQWAIPIPDGVDARSAGPLLCGGITVFNPLIEFDVKPTDKVGVIGIGGLGHLALQFLNKWGCEVTAFTSSDSKAEEAKRLGAHNCVSIKDPSALDKQQGRFNFIISTVNATIAWDKMIGALAPKGRLHVVGAALEPIPVNAFSLLVGQRSISGSPAGSIQTIVSMLDFCARHQVKPVIEEFPMSKANDAFEHLRAGKARYRIVLKNDIG